VWVKRFKGRGCEEKSIRYAEWEEKRKRVGRKMIREEDLSRRIVKKNWELMRRVGE
jgi:hypothetical protein